MNSPLKTKGEAIDYLRLTETGVKNPSRTFDRYRRMRLIRGIRVGKRVFFTAAELDLFLNRQMERVPA